MKKYIEQAVDNIIAHGDTDIFPFPIENHILFDKRKEVITLIEELDNLPVGVKFGEAFGEKIASNPPLNINSLVGVGYTGFRWATQIDPIWNIYYLVLVLSVADKIEQSRIATKHQCVFSYRYKFDKKTKHIFDTEYGWKQFNEISKERAKKFSHILICDVSDFYQRLYHHRLENALQYIGAETSGKKIIEILGYFSNNKSYGIPVGGPASRLLSELLLDQTDKLLHGHGIQFCRFADDFHIFSQSHEEAYRNLVFLSKLLIENEGLTLQKSKTRIMSSEEFLSSATFLDAKDEESQREKTPEEEKLHALMSFSIRFDPYSPTAEADYEELSKEIKKFNILDLLKTELAKSRIHKAAAGKIVQTIKFLPEKQREGAILSLVDNLNVLYPIFSTVMNTIKATFDDLSDEAKAKVTKIIRELIDSESHLVATESNLAFALRVIACLKSEENIQTCVKAFNRTNSILVRRDITLIMAKWSNYAWVSNLRNRFNTLTSWERRVFIIASYILGDEGSHWRNNIKKEFKPFEVLVRDWVADKKNKNPDWVIPI